MNYIGDIRLGDTIDIKFCTVSTTGAPTTLAGTPVISAYPGNSTTELTAGITLTVDFDSRTGMHNVRVVASSGNGYATATNYALVITTGTVGGTSVVGYVIGEFSIEARSAVMPTTAARTLDVSAGGEAGVDWANVGSPTTTLALTGTTIATTQKVDLETIKTQAVTAAAGVTFPTSVASPTNITAGTITTVTNLTNAATAGDFTATMKTSIGTAVAASAVASVTGNVGGNVVGSVGSVVADIAGGVWDVVRASHVTAGTFGEGAPVSSLMSSVITNASMANNAFGASKFASDCFTAAKFAADVTTEFQAGLATAASVTAVASDVTAVKAKTDSLTFTTAGMVDSAIKRVGNTTLAAAGIGGQGYGG